MEGKWGEKNKPFLLAGLIMLCCDHVVTSIWEKICSVCYSLSYQDVFSNALFYCCGLENDILGLRTRAVSCKKKSVLELKKTKKHSFCNLHLQMYFRVNEPFPICLFHRRHFVKSCPGVNQIKATAMLGNNTLTCFLVVS